MSVIKTTGSNKQRKKSQAFSLHSATLLWKFQIIQKLNPSKQVQYSPTFEAHLHSVLQGGVCIFLPKTNHARLCRSNTANGSTTSQQLLRLVLVLRDRRKVRVFSSVSSELLMGEVVFTLQA